MRIIIASLFVSFFIQPVLAQPPSKTQKPVKNEMQAQMDEASNELKKQITELEKQIAEAKKNKEDEETIKNLEDQLVMLKKQVAMIGGVKTGIGKISAKTFQQAVNEENNVAPKKDVGRINMLPKKIPSDVELISFVKNIHLKVEKLIPVTELTEASKIYNETKIKYKSPTAIGNAANGCWIYGHWEKALWLAGKALLDDTGDPSNLNNYASLLSMVGGEQLALPILQWLDNKFPKNSTILNNIGQAWFGLGDMTNAKNNLENAAALNSYHSVANLTLSRIYLSENDTPSAVAALKKSIKKAYTPEKEVELERLGGVLDDDDIDFDYPMDDDPFGLEPFFNEFPSVPGSISETPMASMEWEAFAEATQLLYEKAKSEEEIAGKRTEEFVSKMMNDDYDRQRVLNLHNSNVHIKAGRKLQLAIKKKTALTIADVMNMGANAFHTVTTDRLNALEKKRQQDIRQASGCAAAAAINNKFMSDAKIIIDEGKAAMLAVLLQNKKKIQNYVKLSAYSSLNYTQRMQNFSREIWQKNQWLYTYTATFASTYKSLLKRPAMFSGCEEKLEPAKQTKQLPSFKKPACTHSASLKLPVGGIKEECNTVTIDESRLKYKKDYSQKGEVHLEIGEITLIPTEIKLEIGKVQILNSEPSSANKGKFELEMREITILNSNQASVNNGTTQNSGNSLMPSSSNYVAIGFDGAGNLRLNIAKNN